MVGRSRLIRAALASAPALVVSALASTALVASSCVSVRWERDLRYTPIEGAALDALVPGATELSGVLDAFGAPLVVREHRTFGVQLAYGWSDTGGWGVDVNVPVDRYSASVNYEQVDASLRGVVLLFDEDLLLVTVRRGNLRELLGEPRPPSEPDAIGGAFGADSKSP